MPKPPLLTAAIFALWASVATANSPVTATLPGANLRGEATFRMLGLPVYKARLFTPQGAPLNWSDNFAIELTYQRNLSQYDLVEATMREFKRLGPVPNVRAQLETCFKAVRKGDQYLAVSQGANKVGFWRNGAQVCTLSHPDIKRQFMSIFVGDNTRSKSFTRQLLGG